MEHWSFEVFLVASCRLAEIHQMRYFQTRASQFSRCLLETAGSFDRDTNARASAVKLNKDSYSRAFVAL
jgi:hypothetical protein